MKKLVLDKSSQAIILACKGHYDRDGETVQETLTRVCETISGTNDMHISNVRRWSGRVYRELLDISECEISKHELLEFVMGNSNYHTMDGYKEDPSLWFLRSQIELCRVKKQYSFELVLEREEEYV